jgi:hypothetical protein
MKVRKEERAVAFWLLAADVNLFTPARISSVFLARSAEVYGTILMAFMSR